jgi:hypothetical protein
MFGGTLLDPIRLAPEDDFPWQLPEEFAFPAVLAARDEDEDDEDEDDEDEDDDFDDDLDDDEFDDDFDDDDFDDDFDDDDFDDDDLDDDDLDDEDEDEDEDEQVCSYSFLPGGVGGLSRPGPLHPAVVLS